MSLRFQQEWWKDGAIVFLRQKKGMFGGRGGQALGLDLLSYRFWEET